MLRLRLGHPGGAPHPLRPPHLCGSDQSILNKNNRLAVDGDKPKLKTQQKLKPLLNIRGSQMERMVTTVSRWTLQLGIFRTRQ